MVQCCQHQMNILQEMNAPKRSRMKLHIHIPMKLVRQLAH